MNIDKFYDEVKAWINQCNQRAVQQGMHSVDFWHWVAMSVANICDRYKNEELVKKQMIMLYEWLYDIYEKGKQAN